MGKKGGNKRSLCDVYVAEGFHCDSLKKGDKERGFGEAAGWPDVLNGLICKQTLALSRTIRHNYQRQAPLLFGAYHLTERVRW